MLHAYAAALSQRMGEIRADQQQELTGADLFRTIARQVPVAWEDASDEERALYTSAVQHFIGEQESSERQSC